MKTLKVLFLALIVASFTFLSSASADAQTLRYVKLRIYTDSNINAVFDGGDYWAGGLHVTGQISLGCTGTWTNLGIKTTDMNGYVTLVQAVPTGVAICIRDIEPILPDRCWSINRDDFDKNTGTIGSYVFTNNGVHNGCAG